VFIDAAIEAQRVAAELAELLADRLNDGNGGGQSGEPDLAGLAASEPASVRAEGCTSGAGVSADNGAKPAEKALGATESVAGNLPFASMQRRLTDLVNEMLARLAEEAVNPGFMQLFGPSTEAAALAGLLGFPCPPVEYGVVRRPYPHSLLREHPDWECVSSLQIHDPTGLTYAEVILGANAVDGQTPETPTELPYPDEKKLATMRSKLESWRRAVERRRAEDVHFEDLGSQADARSVEKFCFIGAVNNERRRLANPACDDTEARRALEQLLTKPDVLRQIEESRSQYAKSHPVAARLAVKRPEKQPEAAPETATTTALVPPGYYPSDAFGKRVRSDRLAKAAERNKVKRLEVKRMFTPRK